MDEIIKYVKSIAEGYPLTTDEIKIICFADDALIIEKKENDLQPKPSSFPKNQSDVKLVKIERR